MSRSLCWSVVVLLSATLWPVTRSAVAQIPVPTDQPAAEKQDAPVSVPAVPLMPAVPVPIATVPGTPQAQSPATQDAPAAVSSPVGNEVDAAAQQKIESALDATAEVVFVEAPLGEVVDYLKDRHQIPIIVDKRALDDVGLGCETPVTISLKGVSLRSLLKIMLHQQDLTYVVRDQVLKITTPEEAENELTAIVYAVSDLAVDLQPPLVVNRKPSRYDTVMDMINDIVVPDGWDKVGGAGSAVAHDPSGVIVISQTREAHEAIGSLLAAVRQGRQATAKDDPQAADFAPVPMVQELQTAAHAKILEALASTASLEFNETPLQEVAAFLAQMHGIQVLIDKRALDDVGLGGETPVTVSIKNVSLRCALEIMLKELDLEYVVADEVLKITTPEESENELKTIVYPVRDFVVPQPQATVAAGVTAGLEDLVDVIQTSVAPDSWDNVGGAGTIVAVDRWGVLVVSQTDQVLGEVTNLLQTARRVRQAAGAAPAAPMGMAVPDGEAVVLKLYPALEHDLGQMMTLIKGSVAPETWGPAPDQGAIFPLGGQMLIRQTPAVHAAIKEVLDALRREQNWHGAFGGSGGGMGGVGGGGMF